MRITILNGEPDPGSAFHAYVHAVAGPLAAAGHEVTTFDLRNFAYYPEFLRAMREKFLYERDIIKDGADRRRLRSIREQIASAMAKVVEYKSLVALFGEQCRDGTTDVSRATSN